MSHLLVRRAAVFALGNLGTAARSAVPDLVAALGDANETVRHAAAYALGSVGEEAKAGGRSHSGKVLTGDPDPDVRQAAAFAPGRNRFRRRRGSPGPDQSARAMPTKPYGNPSSRPWARWGPRRQAGGRRPGQDRDRRSRLRPEAIGRLRARRNRARGPRRRRWRWERHSRTRMPRSVTTRPSRSRCWVPTPRRPLPALIAALGEEDVEVLKKDHLHSGRDGPFR